MSKFKVRLDSFCLRNSLFDLLRFEHVLPFDDDPSPFFQRSMGGPSTCGSTCGRVPKAQETAPATLMVSAKLSFVLNADGEASYRFATRCPFIPPSHQPDSAGEDRRDGETNGAQQRLIKTTSPTPINFGTPLIPHSLQETRPQHTLSQCAVDEAALLQAASRQRDQSEVARRDLPESFSKCSVWLIETVTSAGY